MKKTKDIRFEKSKKKERVSLGLDKNVWLLKYYGIIESMITTYRLPLSLLSPVNYLPLIASCLSIYPYICNSLFLFLTWQKQRMEEDEKKRNHKCSICLAAHCIFNYKRIESKRKIKTETNIALLISSLG